MKKGFCLLLCALLCLSACACAEVASVQLDVWNDEMEMVNVIQSGWVYQVLEEAQPGQSGEAMQRWLQTYHLQKVRYTDDAEVEHTGWIISGYVPQQADQPRWFSGRLIYVEGVTNERLCFDSQTKDRTQNVGFADPLETDMPMEEALHLALAAIEQDYPETDETLLRFFVEYGFRQDGVSFPGPYWQFDFGTELNPADGYEVMIHSPDGAVVYLCGPGEGNG